MDTVDGGDAADTVDGGSGQDQITGGDGSDLLRARDGEIDNLDCGAGSDDVIADPEDTYADRTACDRLTTNDGTGPTGPAGDPGPAGPAGDPGATGADGATGATGSSGTNGTNGSTGSTGASGAPGVQGTPGKDGTNGTAGEAGPRGPRGPRGFATRTLSIRANAAGERVLRIRIRRGSKVATGRTVTVKVGGRRYKAKTSSRGIARLVLPAKGKVVVLSVK
jgi:hypothetical protein